MEKDYEEYTLEQIAADYLNLAGYFTQTNIKYLALETDLEWSSRQDSVRSDIDVIGFNPLHSPPQRVVAVSCKSEQEGFGAQS